MSTKFQKFLSTNDHHDENVLVNNECINRPVPEFHPNMQANMNNNFINRPKPFPLYKQLHENLCKFYPYWIFCECRWMLERMCFSAHK